VTAERPADPQRGLRRDAQRNYERILDAARQAFGESGADACMEEIAARAGVGVGTVYRRFASKDALIDELLRLATQELIRDAEHALARTDGYGLHELLRAFGRSFAEHARYANLLLQRKPDASAASKLRQAVGELTSRAVSAGTVNPGITTDDVITLVSAMRGLIHTVPGGTPDAWQRFLDLHLAGMTAPPAQPRLFLIPYGRTHRRPRRGISRAAAGSWRPWLERELWAGTRSPASSCSSSGWWSSSWSSSSWRSSSTGRAVGHST
jgi:AcrR family transcriptional regulator